MMNATLDKLIINMRRKKESTRPHGIADEGYAVVFMLKQIYFIEQSDAISINKHYLCFSIYLNIE